MINLKSLITEISLSPDSDRTVPIVNATVKLKQKLKDGYIGTFGYLNPSRHEKSFNGMVKQHNIKGTEYFVVYNKDKNDQPEYLIPAV